jgi:thiol:disulfide interchange protein DsbD
MQPYSRWALGPLVSVLLFLLTGGPLQAQGEDPSPYSDAWIIPETTSIQPGTPFHVAVYFEMEDGWHNYWRNAGDSGLPTTVRWSLPQGFSAGELQWPVPERIAVYPLVDYGYSHRVALLVEVTPPQELAAGSRVSLSAHVEWLICQDICLPAFAEVEAEIPVQATPPALDPEWVELFRETRASFPKEPENTVFEAEVTEDGYLLRFRSGDEGGALPDSIHFFAADENVLAHAEPQLLRQEGVEGMLALVGSPYATVPTSPLRGVLLAESPGGWETEGGETALWVEAPVDGVSQGGADGTAVDEILPPPSEDVTFALALVFAFLGGILLNLMPCVFPVLSLKILGAVGQGDRGRSHIRTQGIFFGLGVLLSFLALAGLLLLLRAGGAQLGWGFQLQSPLFVAGMAVLFFGIGLNLMGVFEVGASLTRLGARQGGEEGHGGAFASGVLATIIATPCTAPFMGAALGFALTRSVVETLLVFGFLGLGMALPYVVLSLAPGLLERLPRPGPWMETLKQGMAFPMLATVIWLVWVFGQQTGVGGSTYLLTALLMVGVAGWLVGRWHRTDLRSGKVARVLALGAVGLALLFVARGNAQLPLSQTVEEGWNAYDPAEITSLLSSGQPVFLDFTAAWCLTCQVNERLVLSSEAVLTAFRERGVALFKADWTRQDPVITQALQALGRSGVPVYALYHGGVDQPPHLLPEVLTEAIVLAALEEFLPSSGP